MTGFAQVRSQPEDGGSSSPAFTLSLKSVNHRYLDLQMRMPSETDALEMKLRRLLKEKIKIIPNARLEIFKGQGHGLLKVLDDALDVAADFIDNIK